MLKLRALTTQDLQAAYERLSEECLATFRNHGEVRPRICGFNFHERIEGSIRLVHEINQAFVETLHCGPNAKEGIAPIVRALLGDSTHSLPLPPFDVVAYCNEAWFSKNNGLRPSLDPQREECVLIVLNTRIGSFIGRCPILANPRRCEKGPLELETTLKGKLVPGTETSDATRQ